jgi:monofunctional biosynthetic peptidoglycan transglycosylase
MDNTNQNAAANADAAQEQPQQMDAVVVTGTLIRGTRTVGSPVVSLTRTDLERSPAATAALYTLALEHFLTKDRIFELYLNVIEWGNGVFGAEAAARYYYKTSAASLGAPQAAKLAAMVPNPRYFDKNRNDRKLLRKAAIIQRRMWAADFP